MTRNTIALIAATLAVVACGGGSASVAPTAVVSGAPSTAPTDAPSATVWRLDPTRLAP